MPFWPFLGEEVLILETVRARLKRTKFGDHPRNKLANIYHVTVRARGNKHNFWIIKGEKNIIGEKFSFDLEKVTIRPF